MRRVIRVACACALMIALGSACGAGQERHDPMRSGERGTEPPPDEEDLDDARPRRPFARAVPIGEPVEATLGVGVAGDQRAYRRGPDEAVTGCDPAPLIEALGAGCRAIPLARVAADGSGAELAVDNDLCTVWRSGHGVPTRIDLDIDGSQIVLSGVILVPEQPIEGASTHVIEISPPNQCSGCVGTIAVRAELMDGRAYLVPDGNQYYVEQLTIRSVRSPGLVAWREVIPITCERWIDDWGTMLPRAPDPTEPGFVVVPGTGACARDRDCHPIAGCHVRTCTTDPIPEAVSSCPASVMPFDYAGTGCFCRAGTCASLLREGT